MGSLRVAGLAALVVIGLGPPAQGQVFRFEWSGTVKAVDDTEDRERVVSIEGVEVGAHVTGTFEYDVSGFGPPVDSPGQALYAAPTGSQMTVEFDSGATMALEVAEIDVAIQRSTPRAVAMLRYRSPNVPVMIIVPKSYMECESESLAEIHALFVDADLKPDMEWFHWTLMPDASSPVEVLVHELSWDLEPVDPGTATDTIFRAVFRLVREGSLPPTRGTVLVRAAIDAQAAAEHGDVQRARQLLERCAVQGKLFVDDEDGTGQAKELVEAIQAAKQQLESTDGSDR